MPTPHGATIPWSAFEEILLKLVRSKLLRRAERDAEHQAALRHELETIRETYLLCHAFAFPGERTATKAWERMLSVGLDDVVDVIQQAADHAVAQ